MTDPITTGTVLLWAVEHLHIGAAIVAVWKMFSVFKNVESRASQAEQHITKMATNCFPTMQASLQNQDGLMKSMDKSLKTIANQTKRTAAKIRTRKKK